MADPLWTEVEAYLGAALAPDDDALASAVALSRDRGLPQIQVSALQGQLLNVLVRATGARRVLEVGTLGAYSTIWLARGLPSGGQVVSLELEPAHAEVAVANIARAGLSDRVSVVVGAAAATMREMAATGEAPFDLVFIDADKPGYPEYMDLAIRLGRPGTLIVADNVVRQGAIANPEADDPRVRAMRELVAAVEADPRVVATALPTVGAKGYDGMLVAVVVSA